MELDETPITIRVNYTKVYQMLLPQSAIMYYNIDPNATNDVHESIFLLIEPQSPYYQLISYRPYGKVLVFKSFDYTNLTKKIEKKIHEIALKLRYLSVQYFEKRIKD